MTLSPRANAPPTLFPGGAHPRRPPGFVGKGGAREWSELSRLRGSERNGLCPDAGAFLEKRAEKHFQNK